MRRLLALSFLVMLPLLPVQGVHAAREPVLGNPPGIIHAIWGRPLKTLHYQGITVEHYGRCLGTTLPVHLVSYAYKRADIIATYRCDTKREQDWKALAQRFLPTDAVLENGGMVGARTRPMYDSPSLRKAFPVSLCRGAATDRGLVMLEKVRVENHDVWMAGMIACLQPVLGGISLPSGA